MKKNLKPKLMLLLILTLLLSACQGQEAPTEEPKEPESQVMEATVLEVPGQDQLLVEPVEGSPELRSADRIVAHINNAVVLDAGGEETTIESFEVGSGVAITYDGIIAESYPAQITAQKVQQGK